VRPLFEAHTLVLVETAPGTSAGLASLLTGELSLSGSRSLQTQAEIMRSPAVALTALETLTEAQRRAIPADLREALEVRPYRNTDIIEVAVVGYTPEGVVALADAVAERYIVFHEEQTRGELIAAREQVRERLDRMRSELAVARQQVRQFKEDNRTIDLKAEASAAVSDRAGIEAALRTTRAQLAAARAQLDAALAEQVRVDERAVERARVISSAALTELRKRAIDLEQQLTVARAEFTEDSPEVQLLVTQLEQVRGQLDGESTVALAQSVAPLRATVDGLAAQVGQLEAAVARSEQFLASLPGKEHAFAQLQLQAELLLAAYTNLEAQYRKLEIAEESQMPTAQILALATPPERPLKPRRKVNLALGGMLGLILALGLALVADRVDMRVHSADEAGELVGAPVLATIPALPRGVEARMQEPTAPAELLEALRTLRANVGFAVPDGGLRSLAVTSGLRGEGRSFVAANLAVAFALEGRETVLVDADLREATLHERFGVAREPGLTGMIVDGIGLDDALQATGVAHLRLLPAGAPSAHPPELLHSGRWAQVLREMTERAEVVIIDTPPAGVYTDAAIVTSVADAALVVVSAAHARRPALGETARRLALADARVAGVAVTHAGRGFSGYHHEMGRQQRRNYEQTAREDVAGGQS